MARNLREFVLAEIRQEAGVRWVENGDYDRSGHWEINNGTPSKPKWIHIGFHTVGEHLIIKLVEERLLRMKERHQ